MTPLYKAARRLFALSALLITITSLTNTASAQSMGIASTSITPDASSILEMRTTSKGVLVPRMITTERDAISSPATGLMVYNTTTNKFNFYNGSAWTTMTSGSSYAGTSWDGSTIAIGYGGTNSSAALNNKRIMVSSGGAIVEAAALTNGQMLIGSTGNAPVAATLTAGNGITITNASGAITIANEPTVLSATATTDATTTSLTDVLLTGMTVTPGAGDYIVIFTGSYENTNSNKQGPISIYVNGTQVAASIIQTLAPGNQAQPTATQAYVTGVAAGQAIEVRWKVLANTGTFHQRTLIVHRVK
jgi:hypothetical protein